MYLVVTNCTFVGGITFTDLFAGVCKNGVGVGSGPRNAAGAPNNAVGAAELLIPCAANDWLQPIVFQVSAAARNTFPGAPNTFTSFQFVGAQ
jgi:hypothetical protein